MGGGGFGGAITGAIGGFMVGGPVGAIVGAGAGFAAGEGWLGSTAANFVTGGQYGAQKQQRKAIASQNAARAEQAKMQAAQNRRNMIQQIRAARISRAQNLNMYAGEANTTSSGSFGALSSIGSQVSSNINFMQSQENSQNAIQNYMNSYYYHTQKADDIVTKYKGIQDAIKTGAKFYLSGGLSSASDAIEYGGGSATANIGGAYQGTTTWKSR